MSKPIYVINGPNLNLLGTRDPAQYGSDSLDDIAAAMTDRAGELGVTLDIRQSNHEGHIIDWLHEAQGEAAAVILNAGGYSHSSVAIRDAVEAISIPVIDVHLSNIYGRESFRRRNLMASVAKGSITGFGPLGYILALDAAAALCKGAAAARQGDNVIGEC